ncbi:oxidoreductase [Paenibacillus sp. Root444D2]|uniref:oxidoreductase n=1 Tax=Paenibacillus sp. Root444D2 TaxID=1736538 RepID=UPI0007107673|nr:oxidoreductase [Paenibacillus sp. Root444D2]KQX46839.1 oxidoreductase [Paenibacillus sp. Root444D2]
MQRIRNNELTIQAPIHSGFGPRTTAKEALGGEDLRGKVAIVTGGYSGLGLETSRVLAESGATVIIPARTPEKARASVSRIPGAELETLDLLDPASIDAFAQRFLNSNRPLHILINSAGIMASPLARDKRGFESQFATNHLGHFHLTARLWPALTKAKGARVVSVSSRGHRISGIDFNDPNFEIREYDKWKAYGQSKTANALFAIELDKKGISYGIRAFSVHPGTIVTDLSRNLSDEEMRAMGAMDENGKRVLNEYNEEFKTIEEGAATIVWCAVNKQLDGMGGVYCENVDIARAVPADSPQPPGVRPWATNPEFAEQLWELSEDLIGVKFPV